MSSPKSQRKTHRNLKSVSLSGIHRSFMPFLKLTREGAFPWLFQVTRAPLSFDAHRWLWIFSGISLSASKISVSRLRGYHEKSMGFNHGPTPVWGQLLDIFYSQVFLSIHLRVSTAWSIGPGSFINWEGMYPNVHRFIASKLSRSFSLSSKIFPGFAQNVLSGSSPKNQPPPKSHLAHTPLVFVSQSGQETTSIASGDNVLARRGSAGGMDLGATRMR